jgi:hypothetical protein
MRKNTVASDQVELIFKPTDLEPEKLLPFENTDSRGITGEKKDG